MLVTFITRGGQRLRPRGQCLEVVWQQAKPGLHVMQQCRALVMLGNVIPIQIREVVVDPGEGAAGRVFQLLCECSCPSFGCSPWASRADLPTVSVPFGTCERSIGEAGWHGVGWSLGICASRCWSELVVVGRT
jgi:hypothetical protein